MYKFLAVAALGLFSASSWAAGCAVTIEGNDMMQFNLKTIEVPAACTDFTVTMKHVGKLPKASMGHNWVLSTTADEAAINKDGMAAGPANDYLKPDDARIIAHTKLVGGGESDSVTFAVSKLTAGTPYAFFCSFPGHAALMKGTLTVVQ